VAKLSKRLSEVYKENARISADLKVRASDGVRNGQLVLRSFLCKGSGLVPPAGHCSDSFRIDIALGHLITLACGSYGNLY
jgi:hypothetical protein